MFSDCCLYLPSWMHVHCRIRLNVGILMLLPNSDVGDIKDPVTWSLLGLVPNSKVVSLILYFPRQWVHSSLVSACFHKLLSSRTNLDPVFYFVWSIFDSCNLIVNKTLAFGSVTPVALRLLLSAFCFGTLSDLGKGLFCFEFGYVFLVFSFYILTIITICVE